MAKRALCSDSSPKLTRRTSPLSPTQISAVRAALRKAEEEILRDHVGHCVEGAITSGNRQDQRRKIAELMDVLGRSDR